MSKFEIDYTILKNNKEIIEAETDYQALEEFREECPYVAINKIRYIPPETEELKEYYCIWLNIWDNWESAVIKAYDDKDVLYNHKEGYNFKFCLNTPKHIEALHQSIWD